MDMGGDCHEAEGLLIGLVICARVTERVTLEALRTGVRHANPGFQS
jgi:hypothetical protein